MHLVQNRLFPRQKINISKKKKATTPHVQFLCPRPEPDITGEVYIQVDTHKIILFIFKDTLGILLVLDQLSMNKFSL